MPTTKKAAWMDEAGVPVVFIWHGGPNYSAAGHLESADCIESVLFICEERRGNRDGRTPLVRHAEGDTVACVWLDHRISVGPGTDHEYPDALVVFRGGAFVAEPA